MCIRIRAVIIEGEQLAAEYLASLLDDTSQVEVVGTATEPETGLRLCAELRPDAVFIDIKLPGVDGISLAAQLSMLPQPPRTVFTTGTADRAADAFRLEAVDYLLKPLDPEEVSEAVNRLLKTLRPFDSLPVSTNTLAGSATTDNWCFLRMANELLPVRDVDRDKIRLLSRREIVAVLRKGRHTWLHTVMEEFATRYPLAVLMQWLGNRPFIQIGRHAIVNLRAIELVTHYGDRLYRVHLCDRFGTSVTASRLGAARLAEALKLGAGLTSAGIPQRVDNITDAKQGKGKKESIGMLHLPELHPKALLIKSLPRVKTLG